MLDLVAAIAVGYFLGSFPSALLVGRLMGKDIFQVGSGNMGAMNTARNIGWLPGATVLVLDVAKGSLAVLLAGWLAAATAGPPLTMGLAAGSAAVAGHAWPLYTKFRGGKALATTLGVALPIYPLSGIYTMLLLVALVLLTRRATASSIAAILSYPLVVAAVHSRSGEENERLFAILTSVLPIVLIVVWKHLRGLRQEPAREREA